MWFLFAFIAVLAVGLMLLAPKPHIENARATGLNDLTFPKAEEGASVPLLLGRARTLGPNTLWYGDYKATAIVVRVKTGLFSHANQIVGYTYHLGIDLALCLGPDVNLTTIWIEKSIVWSGYSDTFTGTINQPNLFGGYKNGGGFVGNFSFYSGQFSQAQNAYVAAKSGTPYSGVVGISHIVFEGCNIGESAQLRQMSFGIARYTTNLLAHGGSTRIGDDLNPMELLFEVLTSAWGGLNVDPAEINIPNFVAVSHVLNTEGNGMSLLISQSQTGKTIASEVMRQIDGILYQEPSTGLITCKLIRNDFVVSALPVLDPSNILALRTFTANAWSTTYNQVLVKFTNAANAFTPGTAFDQDIGNIKAQSKLRATTVSYPGCTRQDLAQLLATRNKARLAVPLFSVVIEANRSTGQFIPGDCFVWNWPELGISSVVMRVTRVSLGDLLNGRYVFEATQEQFALYSAIYAPPATTSWTPLPSEIPAPVTLRSVFETPYWFSNRASVPVATGRALIGVLAAAPTVSSQGFSAEESFDDFVTTTEPIKAQPYTLNANTTGAIVSTDGFAAGMLTDLALTNIPDVTALTTQTLTDIANGKGMIRIDDEYLAYESFTYTSPTLTTLHNVHRGLLDTVAVDHAMSATVWFVEYGQVIFNADDDITTVPDVVLRDITARATLAIDAAPVDDIAFTNRAAKPLRPTDVAINATRSTGLHVDGASTINISWARRSRINDVAVLLELDADSAGATEDATTTYHLRLYAGMTVEIDHPGISGTTDTMDMSGLTPGVFTLKITAVHGALTSIYDASYTFTVNPAESIITDAGSHITDGGSAIYT